MSDPLVAALWVDVLGRLAEPATHAVNNALNNVAINLAVVRSRTEALAFAERAEDYLTEATRLVKAVVALARPVPAPVEPASLVHQLVLVLEAGGRRIEVAHDGAPPVTTSIDGGTVRLALAAALAEVGVRRVALAGEQVRVEGGTIREDVADAVRRAGVGLQVEPGQVTFTFSRVAISA